MRQNCSSPPPSAARHYNSDLSLWLSVDPMSDKYPGVSPYTYCANNPVRLVDPDGRNPIDPRTGRELRMHLYCASVWYIYYSSKSCRDDNLYNKADRKIIPREFCEPEGAWEGAVAYTPHSSFYQISSTAKNTLKKVIRAEGNFSPREPPCDNAWKSAAEKGNYTFIDNYWDRSLWVKRRINRFNIITVKNNVISQIVNMTRNSDGEYDINSITTFECKFSKIKSKQNWLMLSVNYRTISVKETTQRYKNGQPYGEPTVKTYQSEQIL